MADPDNDRVRSAAKAYAYLYKVARGSRISAIFAVAYPLLFVETIGATPGRIAWCGGNDTPRLGL
jgi:hypothetical protein